MKSITPTSNHSIKHNSIILMPFIIGFSLIPDNPGNSVVYNGMNHCIVKRRICSRCPSGSQCFSLFFQFLMTQCKFVHPRLNGCTSPIRAYQPDRKITQFFIQPFSKAKSHYAKIFCSFGRTNFPLSLNSFNRIRGG